MPNGMNGFASAKHCSARGSNAHNLSVYPMSSLEPLPIPSLETMFEVTVNGRVHKVPGVKLQRWIMKRRQE
jgi:hypothetical protein